MKTRLTIAVGGLLIIGFIVVSAFASTLFAQDGPKLPPFPQRTGDSLISQIGVCNADLSDMQRWAQSLIAEIKKRDDEIAQLKAQAAKKEEPKP